MNTWLELIVGKNSALVVAVPWVGAVDVAPLLIAVGVFLGLTFLFKVVLVAIISRLTALSAQTTTDIDDVFIAAFSGVRPWVYMLLALYIALRPFTLPGWVETPFTAVVYGALVWQAIEVALCFIKYGVQRFVERDEDGDGVIDPNAATASDMIVLLARIVLTALGVLFVLSNLGIEVTSLLAGLGIGGIAVAFALQGILSDLFSSFSLYFDKPFRVGDFVAIGDNSGTVEKIGIKTTRLRTLQGEQLVVSNSELTTARVQNFKKLQRRRAVMQFGIVYETSPELVKAVPGIVEQLLTTIEKVTFDRAHFASFGDSALIFEVVYHVESDSYPVFMDVQQQYNFALMDEFAKRGIAFAYPTQTIYTKAG